MKFLVVAVNSKYIHTNPAVYSLKAYAAYCRPDLSDCISVREYTINQRTDGILRDIYKQKPDILSFSVYIWNVSVVLSLVRNLHKILPDVPLWLGGPEVSYRAKELLESYPELTGVMIGEGEQTFSELAAYYAEQNPQRPDFIDGICYRKEKEICFTKKRKLTDLSSVPFIYDDSRLFDCTKLQNKIIYYESSRGCPFSCSYCLSSIDKKLRLRDLDLVKRELQFFLDHRVPRVKFVDRTFNCDHEHAWEIWNYIKDHDNGITNFHFEIAADLLREEELELLKSLRPGAVQMEIGIQTTNEDTLKEIRRVTDTEKLKQAVSVLRAGKNIHIHLDLIAGLPFEDYERFRQSFNEVYRMKPEQLQLGFLKVLDGSYMKEHAEEYGLFYTDEPPYEVLCTKWLDFDKICRLKRVEEMVEIYYNTGQFSHTLSYLETFFENPFQLYDALADYYEKEGCFVNTPSRIHRYHVLLDFTAGLDKRLDTDLVRELLTMDVYLREPMKSRPDFARDLTPYKDRIRHFYREKKKQSDADCGPGVSDRAMHIEPFFYDICGEAPTYKRLEAEQFVLYDYGERNPLTYDARIYIVKTEA